MTTTKRGDARETTVSETTNESRRRALACECPKCGRRVRWDAFAALFSCDHCKRLYSAEGFALYCDGARQ